MHNLTSSLIIFTPCSWRLPAVWFVSTLARCSCLPPLGLAVYCRWIMHSEKLRGVIGYDFSLQSVCVVISSVWHTHWRTPACRAQSPKPVGKVFPWICISTQLYFKALSAVYSVVHLKVFWWLSCFLVLKVAYTEAPRGKRRSGETAARHQMFPYHPASTAQARLVYAVQSLEVCVCVIIPLARACP